MALKAVSPLGLTCTARFAVEGLCGKPAVYAFTSSDGEVFAECAAHRGPDVRSSAYGRPALGDIVPVHRYGRVYDGKVVSVGARGAVYVEWTYDNGATRTARVKV